MPLQIDATVIYARGDPEQPQACRRRQDLEIKSPYNTYRNTGLPPTPIAAVSDASLAGRARTRRRPTTSTTCSPARTGTTRSRRRSSGQQQNIAGRRGGRRCCDHRRDARRRGHRRSGAALAVAPAAQRRVPRARPRLGVRRVRGAPTATRARARRRCARSGSSACRSRCRTRPRSAGLCDELSPDAAALRSVNTVTRRRRRAARRRLDRRRGLPPVAGRRGRRSGRARRCSCSVPAARRRAVALALAGAGARVAVAAARAGGRGGRGRARRRATRSRGTTGRTRRPTADHRRERHADRHGRRRTRCPVPADGARAPARWSPTSCTTRSRRRCSSRPRARGARPSAGSGCSCTRPRSRSSAGPARARHRRDATPDAEPHRHSTRSDRLKRPTSVRRCSPAERRASVTGVLVLQGTFETLSLPEVLGLLASARKSGALWLDAGPIVGRRPLEDGHCRAVETVDQREPLDDGSDAARPARRSLLRVSMCQRVGLVPLRGRRARAVVGARSRSSSATRSSRSTGC